MSVWLAASTTMPRKDVQPTQVEHASVADSVEANLDQLIDACGVQAQPPAPRDGTSVVGEVIDTHHPHRPGRVLVRWRDADGTGHEHWLAFNTALVVDIGVHVLLTRPGNWPEWLVIAAISHTDRPATRTTQPASTHVVKLEATESVSIHSADGQPLFELAHRDGQAVLRIARDLNLELPGTFRVQADRVELRSRQGGTDVRSDGEMILRSPRIRLN